MTLGNVPHQIDSPKSFVNVDKRELFILTIAFVLVVLIILSPLHLIIKVGIGVFVVGVFSALAFGRNKKSGKKVEEYLIDLLGFTKRVKLHQRGAGQSIAHKYDAAVSVPQEKKKPATKTQVRSMDLGLPLLANIISLSFMAMLLTWIWTGGLHSYINQFNGGF